VGVPLIVGQAELLRFAADQGRGILLNKNILTRGDAARLAAALRRIVTEPSFKQRSVAASQRLRAARVPYRAQAADWVEFAAELRDHSSFLFTQGQTMRWWEVMCVDVGLFLTLVAAAAAWVSHKLLLVAKRTLRARKINRTRQQQQQEQGQSITGSAKVPLLLLPCASDDSETGVDVELHFSVKGAAGQLGVKDTPELSKSPEAGSLPPAERQGAAHQPKRATSPTKKAD